MRSLSVWYVGIAAILVVSGPALPSGRRSPHVVVISIDGLMPRTYREPDWNAPHLKALASAGAFADGVVGVFPTVTYPSHTTLITGVNPAVHGIYTNRIVNPLASAEEDWYWFAREIRARTLPSAARGAGLSTAAIGWPASVGLNTTVLMPELWDAAYSEQSRLLRALGRPTTLLDRVEAADGHPLPRPMSDAARTEVAAWAIRTYQPALLLLHLEDTDAIQHAFGPDSPQARRAIATADREVGLLLEAIDESDLRNDTDVVVESDHGFTTISSEVHLNAAFAQRGWLRTHSTGRIVDWDVYFQSSGGSGFVYFNHDYGNERRQAVGALLGTLAADPAMGIDRVLGRADIQSLGGDPHAAFAIEMKPGFYSEEDTRQLIGTATMRGGHGYAPSNPQSQAALIMAGPDVTPSGSLGLVKMTAIAPTIARWLHVTLSPEADGPLHVEPSVHQHPLARVAS
jgi:predicted AlkP superfamily pyrophosphatase or phosphodiesterase